MDSSSPNRPPPHTHSSAHFIRKLGEAALLMLVILTLVNLLSAHFIVDGRSMEPNFHNGEYIIVSLFDYMLGSPQRGDVIVFRYPHDPSRDFIKRIIGLPGETITIDAGQVLVNGVSLVEPYIKARFTYSGEKTWSLGPHEFFVLGDNRNNSNDSHTFGPIPRSVIVGRARVSYWPIHMWRIIPHHNYNAIRP